MEDKYSDHQLSPPAGGLEFRRRLVNLWKIPPTLSDDELKKVVLGWEKMGEATKYLEMLDPSDCFIILSLLPDQVAEHCVYGMYGLNPEELERLSEEERISFLSYLGSRGTKMVVRKYLNSVERQEKSAKKMFISEIQKIIREEEELRQKNRLLFWFWNSRSRGASLRKKIELREDREYFQKKLAETPAVYEKRREFVQNLLTLDGAAVAEAAQRGNSNAQNNLGVLYANGEGVPQDDVLAYMWFNLAGAPSDEIEKRIRETVSKRMTPEQIAEAQKLSREWKPRGQ